MVAFTISDQITPISAVRVDRDNLPILYYRREGDGSFRIATGGDRADANFFARFRHGPVAFVPVVLVRYYS